MPYPPHGSLHDHRMVLTMFSRDIRHMRPTPRTLNEAFGPYAQLESPPRRTRRRSVGYCLLLACAIVFASLVLSGCGGRPLDSTDDARTGTRSDLAVYVDYGTGCQYITMAGQYLPLTPRLDATGRPMCGKGAS